MRFLSLNDEEVLKAALRRVVLASQSPDSPCSLWTKCDGVFADYFLKNWKEKREPLAFLLYDSPPALAGGAPVFIHSNKTMRLIARFRGAQYVAGYKPTVTEAERIAERERICAIIAKPPLIHLRNQTSMGSGKVSMGCEACS